MEYGPGVWILEKKQRYILKTILYRAIRLSKNKRGCSLPSCSCWVFFSSVFEVSGVTFKHSKLSLADSLYIYSLCTYRNGFAYWSKSFADWMLVDNCQWDYDLKQTRKARRQEKFKALAKRTRKSTQVLDLRFVWPPTCVDLRLLASPFS